MDELDPSTLDELGRIVLSRYESILTEMQQMADKQIEELAAAGDARASGVAAPSVNQIFYSSQVSWENIWMDKVEECVHGAARQLRRPPQQVDVDKCEEAAAAASIGWAEWRTSPALRAVKEAVWRQVQRYFRDCRVALPADATIDAVHIWANVQRDRSWHYPHVHGGSLISGTLYVATPPGAGRLVFKDPRRAHGEMIASAEDLGDRSDLGAFDTDGALSIRAGLLALFPPWLEHYVGATPAGTRVSISFNLPGAWATLAAGTVRQTADKDLIKRTRARGVPSITAPLTEIARRERREHPRNIAPSTASRTSH